MTNDATELPYATGDRRGVPGWWAPLVSIALGGFGVLWTVVGWGSVITAEPNTAAAAGVLLGMLTAATLPAALVGTFLGVVGVQRVGGPVAWVGLALNIINCLSGVAAMIWAVVG
jgi:hypothetical protein